MAVYRMVRAAGVIVLGLAAVLTVYGCEQAMVDESAAQEPAKERPLPTVGVCTSVGNAEKLKAAGYDYAEDGVQRLLMPQEPADKFAPNLAGAIAAPLPVYAYAGFLPGDLTCVGPEAKHEAVLDYARTAFDRAAQVGSRIIVFGSGRARRVPEGFSHEQAMGQFLELLEKMGPIAAEYGILVAIEPLNKNECNLVNTVRQGTQIVRAVNHPNIRVLADIYHMALEEEGPESIIEAGPLLVHVHIAEKEGRARPGAGGYDFVPYFAALRQIGYTGGISLECRWQNFDAELAPALAYVKGQLEEAWRQ